MPGNRLRLSRITLPPELSQKIVSTMRGSEVASAATLVGESATPLAKRQFVGDTTGSGNRPSNTPRLVLLGSPDRKVEVFYDRKTNEFYTLVHEETSDHRSDDGDEMQEAFLKQASRLARSVSDEEEMGTDMAADQSPHAESLDTTPRRELNQEKQRRPPKPGRPSQYNQGRARRSAQHQESSLYEGEDEDDTTPENLDEAADLHGDNDTRMSDHAPTGGSSGVPDQDSGENRYVTFEDMKYLASHFRDAQQATADQIVAALRDSRRDSPDSSDNERNRPRRTNPRKRPPKKSREVAFRSPYENELSDKIRLFISEELTPRGEWLVNLVTTDDIEKFNPEIEECCTAGDFRLHLEGTPCNVWNKSATRVLVNSFMEVHKEYNANDEIVREMVSKKCAAVVRSTITRYKTGKKVHTVDSLKEERKTKNKAERKRALFHRRRDLTYFYPALQPQRRKLDLLGVAGMSSDEEEKVGGRRQWRILAPRWRATRVTGWLRYFDALYDRARELSGDARGSHPRHRGSARRTSENIKFVRGLPRNAYRQSWLGSLVDIENVVKPTANISWTHDEKIIELALGLNSMDGGGNGVGLSDEEGSR